LNPTLSPGVLVLVAGRQLDNDPLQPNIYHVANAIYRLFQEHRYPSDRIYYLAADLGLPGVRASATANNLQRAITEWARDKVDTNRPFTLYLVDHGSPERLYLDNPRGEWVTSQQLNDWLTELEQARPGVKINVIIEACYAGSFIDLPQAVSKPGRVIIASTSTTESAFASDMGAVFSDHFVTALDQSQSLFSSFETARSAAQVAHWFQTPWLDDNGDGVPNSAEDGREAARRGFAYAGTLSHDWPPYIIQANATLEPGLQRGVIRAQVLDDTAVRRVWAVIFPPSYRPPIPGEQWGQDNLPTVVLLRQTGDWYSALYPGFSEVGMYRVVVYAEDEINLAARPTAFELWVGQKAFVPLLLK
jgi:hypothetical protein